jgi:hypothetical protein
MLGGDEGFAAVILPAQDAGDAFEAFGGARTVLGCEAVAVAIGPEDRLRCCGCPVMAKVFAGVLE